MVKVKMASKGSHSSSLLPQSSEINPQSETLHFCCRNAKNSIFCSIKKLNLRHFYHECRKNLNIYVLRIKFLIKSAFQDFRNSC